MSAPFTGITVLEYADFIAGPYCARLLGDLGATVIKIEPPDLGDSARGYGPFPGGVPDREKSGLFLYLGINKQSVTLNPGIPAGRDLFVKLVETADVLVEDAPPGAMAQLGLGYVNLKEINPRIIHVSITPYGQDGPKAGWKARHINSFHASGEGFTLPGGATFNQFPDRAPVAAGVHLGEYDAGVSAASGVAAALYAREIWGIGQHVDVSKQESTLALNRLTLTQAQADGEVVDRSRSYVYGGIFPCSDGYVMIYPREDRQWSALTSIMGQPDLAEAEQFRTRTARIQNAAEVNRIISQWTASRTKEEIYNLVAPSGCPAALYATPEDLYRSPQLQSRQFFRQVDHPKAGTLAFPVRPYTTSNVSGDAATDQIRPAPLLGQHNEEIFCGRLGLCPEQLSDLRKGGAV